MYKHYLKEREDADILETETGFVIYKTLPQDKAVYIQDIYVHPEHRKHGVATELANIVCRKAKSEGLTKCYGSIDPVAKNSTASMWVLLAYGMQLSHLHNNLIYMVKSI